MQYNDTPLLAACENGHAAVVELLLKAGAETNIEWSYYVRGQEPIAAFALVIFMFILYDN
jgi:ankyrin repeat protein